MSLQEMLERTIEVYNDIFGEEESSLNYEEEILLQEVRTFVSENKSYYDELQAIWMDIEMQNHSDELEWFNKPEHFLTIWTEEIKDLIQSNYIVGKYID